MEAYSEYSIWKNKIQGGLMEAKWNIKQGYFLVRVTGKLMES